MVRHFFWNSAERRLRTGWRLLFQALGMTLLALAPVILIGESLTALNRHGAFPPMSPEVFDKAVNLIVGPVFTLLVIASVWLAGRWLDRRRWADFGLHLKRRWWSDLALGFALGALLMSCIFGVEYAAGWITLSGRWRVASPELPLSLALVFSAVKALCVGNYEEFLARGYQLKNLAEGFNGWWRCTPRRAICLSALATSLIFGLLHAGNENATALSTLGLCVNGLLLAEGYVLTGELALPIGLHIGWNLFEGSVFGFPVSGERESAAWLALEQGGPAWLTGGAFGPEGGLVGIAAMGLGMALICAWVRVRDGKVGLQERVAVRQPVLRNGGHDEKPVSKPEL